MGLRVLQRRKTFAPHTGTCGEGDGGMRAERPTEDGGDEAGKTFTQADIDRIIEREQVKWKRAQERAVQTARTQAEQLASMTAEQRAAHEHRQREAELSAREAEITKRELRAQALQMLSAEKMPVELAELLHYQDAEHCSASIEALKKVWSKAVQAGVEARVTGGTPKAGTATGHTDYARKAAEAAAAGNMSAAAYYTRLAGQSR